MPRTHLPGASTLRNRNRITNKTRLKIIRGNVDADDLLIPDEDEEKHRLTNLVAGVDAEDANEHHLQEVLSAAHRNSVTKKTEEKPAAYIPTPEANFAVDDYAELYHTNRWKDPHTYVSSSTTVEESIANGLVNGFTYYMDERDKEWLDKNNEEARGEGTSAQGAVSASGTRTSARSAKAKGKEPDVSQPVVITEDEFELVMGLFEKVTHEKTEFLHHSLETGMPFPAFTEYQDTFSSPLSPAAFASYTVPEWIPQSAQLVRIARAVYPYWKERRVERAGHRIIPTLNFDEADTLNESYICFRRREIKAVRKTRQAQVTSSDKLARLQTEFIYPLELAKLVLQREMVKKECAQQAQQVWEKRMALADIKRKFPSFSDKLDEELLIDKERKKPERLHPPKLSNNVLPTLPPLRPEIIIKPRERIAQIKEQVDSYLAKQKDVDRSWEDVVDNPYQTPQAPYASRLFQYIPPPDAPSWPLGTSDKTSDSEEEPEPAPKVARAVRLRYGRGGRLMLDRRDVASRRSIPTAVQTTSSASSDDKMDVDCEDQEETARRTRLAERWRYDMDDAPPSGPLGPDEQDRALVDDYDPKYLRYAMTIFNERDHQHLSTDPVLLLPTQDGRQQTIVPYRLGMPPMVRRDQQGHIRPVLPMLGFMPPGGLPPNHPAAMQMGTPVSMQHQIKKMPPPNALPQMRISSNGGMRPPSLPNAGLQSNAITPLQSPPHPLPIAAPSHPPANGINGVGRAAIAMPHVDMVKGTDGVANGAPTDSTAQSQEVPVVNGSPIRPKSQNQAPIALTVPTTGYHLTPMNPATAALVASGNYAQLQNAQRTALNMQKMQELKSAFANLPPQELAALQSNTNRALAGNFIHPNGNNINLQMPPGTLKLPASRQMQWALGAGMQRPASAVNVNGLDGVPINGTVTPSPSPTLMIPVRSPSANGVRAGMRLGPNGQLQMSPHLQHTPSPMPNISQSPPRLPLTPTMSLASPPLQHQQPVGSTQNGY